MPDFMDVLRSRNELQPGADFEDRVFCKIRRKKRLRKVRYGLSAVAGTLLLFSLLQVFRPAGRPALQTETQPPVIEKEEIPLHENLFFSTADPRTSYSLESVSMQKSPAGAPATVNEI